MTSFFSFFRGLLRLLKILSGCLYLFLAGFVWYLASQQQPEIVSATFYFTSLSFIAFRFARRPGRPFENGAVLFVVSLQITALIFLLCLDIWSQREGALWVEDLSAFFTVSLFAVLPAALQLSRLRNVRSRNLATAELEFVVLRSFASDVVEVRSWTWIDHFRYRLSAAILWLPFFGEVLFFALGGCTFRFGWTFESRVRTGLESRYSRCATVHNPEWGLIPPVMGTVIKINKREDWRDVVRSAMAATKHVVVLAGLSEGLKEEIKMIREQNPVANRIFVMVPPNLTNESTYTYGSLLAAEGFTLAESLLRPGGLYVISVDWTLIELSVGIESGEEASYEILAWRMFGTKPEAQWCEFDNASIQPTALGRCPRCGLILDPSRLNGAWPNMGQGGNFRVLFEATLPLQLDVTQDQSAAALEDGVVID